MTLPAETASVSVTVTAAANDTNDGNRIVSVAGDLDGTGIGSTTITIVDDDATTTAPEVTVSETALTVTEEDATGNSYTVALETQPTADVVVTVAGHAGTEVTPAPNPLTFTTTNWNTVQTVTGDGRRRCGLGERYGHADPQRGEHGHRLQRDHDHRSEGDGERQRHRAGDGGDGRSGQRSAGGGVDGGGQRHWLQGAVEVWQPGLQRHRPAAHPRVGFDDEPHDPQPRQRHRIHGAGDRDPDRRQRRAAVGGEDGHAGGADRAGGHGVEDGADGDRAGHNPE